MPTYEYRCSDCKKSFTKFQPISAATTSPCPRCSKPSPRSISAGSGIVFKGSGFYVTDYKKKSTDKAATTDAANKSEAKPVAKASQ